MSSNPLHHLRKARKLTIGVLAWLVLSLAAAVLAPAMANSAAGMPGGQICSTAGNFEVPPAGFAGGSTEQAVSGWHCVMCFSVTAPVSVIQADAIEDKPREIFQLVYLNAPLLDRWAGPPPGRGPPASL
jgi:hypothetical protein